MNKLTDPTPSGRAMIRAAALVIVVLLSIAWILLLLRIYLAAFLAGSLTLLGVASLALHAYVRFRGDPATVEKSRLTRLLSQSAGRVAGARDLVAELKQERARRQRKSEEDRAERQAKSDRDVAKMRDSQTEFRLAMDTELVFALKRLRREAYERGLESHTLLDASIKGVGSGLKDRLANHGITSALEVETARIMAVPGFGEAKVGALMAWRAVVESSVEAGLPTTIPDEMGLAIRGSHQARIEELDSRIAEEHGRLKADLIALEQEALRFTAQSEDDESVALQSLSEAEAEWTKQKDASRPYEGVSYGNFVRQRLSAADFKPRVGGMLVTGWLTVAFACGLCGSASAMIGGAGGAVIASIPTSTPTPTITPSPTTTQTPTASWTATPSATPTATATPTITATASHTPTPTSTSTPTRTRTPTPSATRTRRPSPTSPPIMVRCGAICRDGTYSSATGSGACSHHGGVAQWLLCPAY